MPGNEVPTKTDPPTNGGGIFVVLCFVTERKSETSTCPSNEFVVGLTDRPVTKCLLKNDPPADGGGMFCIILRYRAEIWDFRLTA